LSVNECRGSFVGAIIPGYHSRCSCCIAHVLRVYLCRCNRGWLVSVSLPVRRGCARLAYKHDTQRASYRDCSDCGEPDMSTFPRVMPRLVFVSAASGSVFNACHCELKIAHQTEAPVMGFGSSSSQNNRNENNRCSGSHFGKHALAKPCVCGKGLLA
jgi:hypothetical protein